MGHHFNLRQLASYGEAHAPEILAPWQLREHQFFVRIFVIVHQQSMVAAAIQRNETEIVVVVAELAGLLLRGLRLRIKLWSAP